MNLPDKQVKTGDRFDLTNLSSHPKISPGLAAIVGLLLITAEFRLERLTTIPPGMHNDIAQYISDGLRISRSWTFPLFLDSRPEPFWRYFLGIVVWWTGAVPFAEKYAGIIVGLLTVAVLYRALLDLFKLWPWITPRARLLGALVGAAALTSNVALQFINRQGFRAGLLPLALAVMLLLWARAWRKRRLSAYFWAGIGAGLPVNAYTAGLAALAVGLGVALYMLILGCRNQRPGWRGLAVLLVGMLLAAAPQIYLAVRVPDLYGHIRQMQVGDALASQNEMFIPPLPDLLNRLNKSTRAFYATGFYALNYNTPNTPFLNPALALLAAIGVLAAILDWRTLPGVLSGALLVAMTAPGALSMDPDNSIRLCGTFTALAALAGLGAGALATLAERVSWQKHAATAGAVLCVLVSPAVARQQFDAHWVTPKFWADPEYWLSFPHYFSINYTDLLTMLQHIDHPVYMPMPQIDSATASWYLAATAFPNVKGIDSLDPLAGAQGLPDAELWYPYAAEFNVVLRDPAEQFALLEPGPNGRGGTITILPPVAVGTAAALRARAEKEGAPIIDNRYGWRLGWRLPVKPVDVTAPASHADWHDVHARFGDSLELIGYDAPFTLVPGQPARITLYWRTLAAMRFDAFDFVQFLDTNNRPYGTTDAWPYHWIHPSVFWQPGEVIPDVRLITLPPDMIQGAYRLAVGVYMQPREQRLPVTDVNGQRVPDDWLTLENHRVPLSPMPAPPTDAKPINAQFGDVLSLDAYTSDVPLADAKPGDVIHVRQYWHATGAIDRSYTLFVHVMDRQGQLVAQQDVQPFEGRYPTNVWAVGEPIALDFALAIPANAPPGPYEWRVGAYSFPSLERLTVTQDGQSPDDRRAYLR